MSKRKFPLEKFPELLKNPPPDVDIMLYDKKKEGSTSIGDHTVKQSRMDRLEKRMDRFEERIDRLEERFDRLEERFDRLEESIANLAKIVSDGFNEVRKDIRDINARLDYNGLKKLPN